MTKYSKNRILSISGHRGTWSKMIEDQYVIPNRKKLKKFINEAGEKINERLVEEAQDRCPIDSESLEQSIVGKRVRSGWSPAYVLYVEDRPMSNTDSPFFMVKGEDGNYKVVKGEVRARQEPRSTAEYASMVNSNLTPIGNKAPSLKSQMKSQKHGPSEVGGGFIERAILESEMIVKYMLEEMASKHFERK